MTDSNFRSMASSPILDLDETLDVGAFHDLLRLEVDCQQPEDVYRVFQNLSVQIQMFDLKHKGMFYFVVYSI